MQVSDRWPLWHGLAEMALKEVGAHSACRANVGRPPREGTRAQSTRERWQQVHQLLDAGVGLLECSRRLDLSLNTVKRYVRHSEPERMVRAPQCRPTMVDPYRDHLRRRSALTLPWYNSRTEGVNNKIKLIKWQTNCRAGHPLLRQRTLLS